MLRCQSFSNSSNAIQEESGLFRNETGESGTIDRKYEKQGHTDVLLLDVTYSEVCSAELLVIPALFINLDSVKQLKFAHHHGSSDTKRNSRKSS